MIYENFQLNTSHPTLCIQLTADENETIDLDN